MMSLTFEDLEKSRKWFHSKDEKTKSNIVCEIQAAGCKPMRGHQSSGLSNPRRKLQYSLPFEGGIKNVCRAAMLLILGISKGKWDNCLKKDDEGSDREDTGFGFTKQDGKAEATYRFLFKTTKRFGSELPNSKDVDLPSNFTKIELWRMLVADLAKDGHDVPDHEKEGDSITVSWPFFVKFWQAHT